MRQRLAGMLSTSRSLPSVVHAVEDAIGRILDSPERWRIVDGDVRRCLTRGFPYALLYTVETDFVLILAVMHFSRRPGYWTNRIAP